MTNFKAVSVKEALRMIQETPDLQIIDVRKEQDFERGHIPNAIHADVKQGDAFAETNPQNKPTLVYCYAGISSQWFSKDLIDSGMTEIYNLTGGYNAWVQEQASVI